MGNIFSFLNAYNYIDLIIIIILLFYAVEGFALGGVGATFDLVKFVTSFFIGLKTYGLVGDLLVKIFSMPEGFAKAIGFFIAAFLAEMILQIFAGKILKYVKSLSFIKREEYKKVDKYIGILPGCLSGAILIMFLLIIIVALPVSPYLKTSINNSVFGSLMVSRSQILEKQVSGVFGGAANETLNFLTVEPESNSIVNLHFTVKDGSIDENAESEMLQLVNNERAKNGFPLLVEDSALTQVARAHAKDMLSRGYFSHYTPEGLSPFDRMTQAGIEFTAAGENLAFSPNVQIAMQGLMNSPGHRANILSKDFGKVGIGVVNAGIFGEMFVQDFIN